MEGLFVAGAVVAVVQFVRARDRRLLPLAFFLAFLGGIESREPWEPWRRRFQLAAVGSGLALAAMITADSFSARAARRS